MSEDRITEIARRLLELQPDPIPRYRILKDLLKRPVNDQDLLHSQQSIRKSRWFKDLSDEQRQDGGWTRFHSADYSAKRRIQTTEAAVGRIVELGVDPNDRIVVQAVSYLERLLTNGLPWPETKETNDRWPVGQQMFVAGTLAKLRPDHELLREPCRKWGRIAAEAFASGHYDSDAEWKAHCQLTGATSMRGSYLVLRNRYALELLTCQQTALPRQIERALLDWLWSHPEGLGYADVPLSMSMRCLASTKGQRWLDSHKLLSGFPAWSSRAAEIMRDLWSLQNGDGLWDFGPSMTLARLSENHRKRANRVIDHSVHVLLLLDVYFSQVQGISAEQEAG